MVKPLSWQGRIGVNFALASCVLQACGSYDTKLLTPPPLEQPPISGSGGHGTDPDTFPDSGTGGHGMQPQTARCGDGLLNGNENCDLGIAEGKPGACPTKCDAVGKCYPRAVTGSGCQATCVVLQPTCTDGDGCCSGNCTSDNDNDCSSTCGDGIVQGAKGETCDPGKDNESDGGASVPCKTQSDCDDHDACTLDVLTGSEQNCNAACPHVAVTAANSGDGCCPKDANANTDGDCKPTCGNGVREGDEACDGGDGCTSACKIAMTPEQQHCLDNFVTDNDPCEHCMCLNCTPKVLDCRDSTDATRNGRCTTVVQCANKQNCAGEICYCGSSYDPNNPLACYFAPDGPCIAEIQAAAGSYDGAVIQSQSMDPNTAVGRSLAEGRCGVEQCADVCP